MSSSDSMTSSERRHASSKERPLRRRRRGHAIATSAWLAVACGAALSLPGCKSNPPTVPEINEQYNEWVRQLKEARDEMLKECKNAAKPAECEDAVRQWYREAMTLLNQGRQAAVNKNWEDAYERRKAWEEKLRDMLPNFPDIKDISLPFAPAGAQSSVTFEIDGTPITMGDPCEPIIAIVSNANPAYASTDISTSSTLMSAAISNPCFMANENMQGTYLLALAGQSLTLSGTIGFENEALSTSATIAGSISIAGVTMNDGSYSGRVNSGAMTVNITNGGIATLNVVPDAANEIDIAPGGAGTVTILFSLSHSDVAWNAILPGYVRFQFPVTRASDGALSLHLGPTLTSDLVPFRPHPLSDYNQDGAWDYTSDLAAFMVDWKAHRMIADRDENEVWDSNDIELWSEIFWHDALHD